MRNLLFSLFAIGVAAVAAMTATTALLNAPQRNAPATVATTSSETPPTQPSQLAVEGQATPPPAGNTSTPTAPSDGAKPAAGAANGPRVIAETPLRQLGDPADLEGLVVLLASGASRHITGQIIAVDGGASVV